MHKLIGRLTLLSLGLSAGLLIADDMLSLSLDNEERSKWELVYNKRKGDVSTTEFVPKGETVDNWTRKLKIRAFRKGWGAPSLQSLVEQLKDGISRTCPSLTWNVIENSKSEILYEWSIQNCHGKDQHEIAKWVQGKNTQYWVQYTHNVADLEMDEHDFWMKVIRETHLVQGER